MTSWKSLKMLNQKSRTPEQEIPLKNEKSRTLDVKVIYPSGLRLFLGKKVSGDSGTAPSPGIKW